MVALADLAAHEVSTENVVHRLEVTGNLRTGDPAAERLTA